MLLFVSLLENRTHGIVACVCSDDEWLFGVDQEEGKRFEQFPREVLESSVPFRCQVQGMIGALSRFRLGELKHGVERGRVMGIEADKFLVVVHIFTQWRKMRKTAFFGLRVGALWLSLRDVHAGVQQVLRETTQRGSILRLHLIFTPLRMKLLVYFEQRTTRLLSFTLFVTTPEQSTIKSHSSVGHKDVKQ